MLYKTMTLELLQQRPQIYEQLQSQRKLLATLDHYAMELKALHELWKAQLAKARPESAPEQIASEALELALHDLADSLPTESSPTDDAIPLIDADPTAPDNPSQPV